MSEPIELGLGQDSTAALPGEVRQPGEVAEGDPGPGAFLAARAQELGRPVRAVVQDFEGMRVSVLVGRLGPISVGVPPYTFHQPLPEPLPPVPRRWWSRRRRTARTSRWRARRIDGARQGGRSSGSGDRPDEVTNPWLTGTGAAAGPESRANPALSRDWGPEIGVPQDVAAAPAIRTPAAPVSRPVPAPGVWWLGTHGGAGESTLARFLPGSHAADHAWPASSVSADAPVPVVLVARTNVNGLISVQQVARRWAEGTVSGVQVLGLVLIADVPGRRLPPVLRDLVTVVAGGMPHVWHLPWVEAWRLSPASASGGSAKPPALVELLHDVQALVESATEQSHAGRQEE